MNLLYIIKSNDSILDRQAIEEWEESIKRYYWYSEKSIEESILSTVREEPSHKSCIW